MQWQMEMALGTSWLVTWHDFDLVILEKTFLKEEIVCFFHAWCVVYFLGMAILLLLLNVWSANKSNLEPRSYIDGSTRVGFLQDDYIF